MTTTISNEAVSAAVNSPEGKRRVADLVEANTRANAITRRGDEIYDSALKEFGQAKLDKALGNFKAFDGLKAEIVETLLDEAEGHKVLFEIGSNPDLIDRLYKMPATKMIAEVARMAARATAAKKPVDAGKADGDGGGGNWTDPSASMDDFMKGREKYLSDKRKAQRGGVRVY
jgi:hypothetical protein